jgi:P4 family phage/plasmid primase-like protien
MDKTGSGPQVGAADAGQRASAIVRALRAILTPGQVTELRALDVVESGWRSPHTVSGYFDAPEKLAAAAAGLAGAKGIYFVPNPIKPALLARAMNRVRGVTERNPTTSDSDILVRHWLLIDVDPTRPSGISASNREHEIALAKAREICEALTATGWPAPLLADSGNGGHLMYRMDMPANDNGLVKQVLVALAFRFDDPEVKVDQTVHNPARIWKLYETMSRKGDHTAERPHRLSQLINVPDRLELVCHELLVALAQSVPVPPQNGRVGAGGGRAASFNLEHWIVDHGLDVLGPSPWEGGRRWIFRICPWNPDHRNRSAYIVELQGGAIAAGCHHNGCSASNWRSLRDLYEPGWRAGKGHDNPEPEANGNGKQSGRAPERADPERFWEGKAFRPALLADELMGADHYISAPVAEDGVGALLYAYREGVFVRAEELASKKAESLLDVRASNARIEDAVKLIRRRVATPHEELNPRGLDLINVKNGMLDWKTGVLLPHDAAFISTIRIPVFFDPSSTSEIIDTVLRDWFPGDAVELAGEMLGYLLIPTRKYQVATMLVGEGENGKSTFINLARSFLGRNNVSTETLHDLEENRFRVASLFGKLANLCADIDDRALRFTGVFKKITGDDSLAAERKHQHPFDFDPFARLIFSANTPPAPRGDRTHAFFRRWVIVPFDNSFRDENKRDRDLLKKITTPKALSAVLNLAVAGLQRLEARGGFDLPESVRKAGEKYRRDADAVYTFIAEECGHGGRDSIIAASEIYRLFKAWCEDNGHRIAPAKRALEQQLVELLGAEKDRARVGKQRNAVAVWRGVTCSYSSAARGREEEPPHPSECSEASEWS